MAAKHPYIITIDGPAGSGKSTVALNLANKLGVLHLNSGALYRAVGLEAFSRGCNLENDDEVTKVARSLKFEFRLQQSSSSLRETHLFVEGSNLTASGILASEEAGGLASRIAVLPKLRDVLTEVQREIGRSHSAVLEGRDAGSVVFPKAELKFYLDAPLEVRARRRFGELGAKGVSFEQVSQEMADRDLRDGTRSVAPQVAAADAIKIDTSNLSVDQVVAKLFELVVQKGFQSAD